MGLISTNDKCIGCNKCVRICSSDGASVPKMVMGRSVIEINKERCINCGACIEICSRGAREYRDDTERFFADLKQGQEISLLVAPSFLANYPEDYARILGGLKECGVREIIPVSLGADICTWAYLKCILERDCKEYLSTTCPVVVAYVEHCMPELVGKLMPVLSPMMCAAVYCREVLGMKDRLAFLGPCLAKRVEMDQNPGLVEYNVTFDKLMEYAGRHQLPGPEASIDMKYGLGAFYPAPGGLADNLKWFMGEDAPIRVVSGKSHLFHWLKESKDALSDGRKRYVLMDLLNCTEGCVEGNESSSGKAANENSALYHLNMIRKTIKDKDSDSPWNPELSPEERLRNLNLRFQNLNLESYLFAYQDRSIPGDRSQPSTEEAEMIYQSMHKLTEESRMVDCAACGYETCHEMMTAIYHGFNTKYNCVYYRNMEELLLERMALNDQLTGVMNRNALERRLDGELCVGKPVGVIVADVNGLKWENDTKGHAAGDDLIKEAARLMTVVYGKENVFRMGGDEFIILVSDCYEDELGKMIQDVQQRLKDADVSVSMGEAFCDRFDGNFKKLQNEADVMMYQNKARYYQENGDFRRNRII